MGRRGTEMKPSDLARRIEYGCEIGYRTTKVEGSLRVEPINPQLQAVFEAAMSKLRQK